MAWTIHRERGVVDFGEGLFSAEHVRCTVSLDELIEVAVALLQSTGIPKVYTAMAMSTTTDSPGDGA